MATISASKYALKRAEKELNQTKVVLRHLPADYTEQDLLELINSERPGYTSPQYTSFYFVPGSESNSSLPSYSRAYFEIPVFDDIKNLRDTFDGLQLGSKTDRGPKSRLIVEFAPYQGSLLQRCKTDPRCDTITKDSEYVSFLEEYEKETAHLPSIDISYLDTVEHVAEVQPTPLVDFIKERKIARRSGGSRNKVLYATGGGKKKKTRETRVIEIKEKPSSSSKDKQWKEKGSGVDKKSSSYQDKGSGQERKGSGYQDKGSGHEKKSKDFDRGKTNGDQASGGEGGGSNRKKGDDSKSKERPDQALYSPRSRRSGNEDKRYERSSKGDDKRGGSSRNEDSRRGGYSDDRRSMRSEERKGGRSDERRGGDERRSDRQYDKTSSRSSYDKRSGSGYYREDSSRSHYKHGGKTSSGYHATTDNYYHFQDDDEPSYEAHRGSGKKREEYSERDDRRYYGNRRNYDDTKKYRQ
ncbi:PREDICTED: regulator of nonsense transcripts 3A-like [Amphimedon queenslandica]|uniref:UPF3 domain-containing protein n=1 Tax=Amphimedon queenslandica TaxID=400682 RepID=A0A1X7VE34_AMPQE|nr:PREDICTED: regulator of nonsense transcripts 3A-like [Amphimedon queenslandica]|eukprot:XP_011402510.1 PREDICTED: regulator of nonsense transcripts 3A-like [Amphimedon queenslandica]